jgi:hypothetical protein
MYLVVGILRTSSEWRLEICTTLYRMTAHPSQTLTSYRLRDDQRPAFRSQPVKDLLISRAGHMALAEHPHCISKQCTGYLTMIA